MQERKYKINESGQLVSKSDSQPIPEDEPLFILRAQDRNALAALTCYQALCLKPDHKASVQKSIDDFNKFRAVNPERMKEPDTPAEY